jgi:DNA-binding MarR family transcriptional regulator/GNAT superfamily N-acetyltransferase
MDTVAAVRRFNRFYTRIIGVLDEGHLESDFALAEVRLLFEIAHRASPTATELVRDLALDAGYVSRLLRGLARRRLVKSTRSADDGRERHLSLTATGRTTVADLEARASADVINLLGPLDDTAQTELVEAMERVRTLLDVEAASPAADRSVVLRGHVPGDMGWVVQRHGELYYREYGWDERFEALVAGIVAGFIEHLDPQRERCWIAESDGVKVGCIFLVRHPERAGVAQLRLFLVEPSARGLGIGHRLVDQCIRFSRAAGYHTMMLWTNDVLVAARHIYIKAGFELVLEEKHHSYGHDLTAQTWELSL